jgi:hypothetical protein
MNFGYVSRSRRRTIANAALVGGPARVGKLQIVLQLRMRAYQQEQIDAA